MVGEHAGTTSFTHRELEHPDVVEDRDPWVRAHAFGEYRRDGLPGLRPAGMDDAAHRVASLPAEPFVEADSELDELGDPRRGLLDERGDGARTAEPPARAERVGGMELGRVALPHGRGDTALGLPAVRRCDGRLREQKHLRLGRRRERGCQAGDAPADDDRVERSRLVAQTG